MRELLGFLKTSLESMNKLLKTKMTEIAEPETVDIVRPEIQLATNLNALLTQLFANTSEILERQDPITTSQILGITKGISGETITPLLSSLGLSKSELPKNPQALIDQIKIPNLETAQLLEEILNNLQGSVASGLPSESVLEETINSQVKKEAGGFLGSIIPKSAIMAQIQSKIKTKLNIDVEGSTYKELFEHTLTKIIDQLRTKISSEKNRLQIERGSQERLQKMGSIQEGITEIGKAIEEGRKILAENGDPTQKLAEIEQLINKVDKDMMPELTREKEQLTLTKTQAGNFLKEISEHQDPINEALVQKIREAQKQFNLDLDEEYFKQLELAIPKKSETSEEGIVTKTGYFLYDWTIGWIAPRTPIETVEIPPQPTQLIARARDALTKRITAIDSAIKENEQTQAAMEKLKTDFRELQKTHTTKEDLKSSLAELKTTLDELKDKLDSYNKSYFFVKWFSRLFNTQSYRAHTSQKGIEEALNQHGTLTKNLSAAGSPQGDSDESELKPPTLEKIAGQKKELQHNVEELHKSVLSP